MDINNDNIGRLWEELLQKENSGANQENKISPDNVNFDFFITTLSIQAAIFLGKLKNPATDKNEENPRQAKFIINTLDMLRKKTKNNLSKEESEKLDNLLYELKTAYITKEGD